MKTFAHCVLWALAMFVVAGGPATAQNLAKIVTKADVEKVTGAKFRDGWQPMPTQMSFAQDGGDLQISVDVESREASSTVRGWEASIKKMQPSNKVDTVPGVGKDAIYYSMRPDTGAVSADFDSPRVQLRVSVAGAKTPTQANQVVVDLAKIVGPRVGK